MIPRDGFQQEGHDPVTACTEIVQRRFMHDFRPEGLHGLKMRTDQEVHHLNFIKKREQARFLGRVRHQFPIEPARNLALAFEFLQMGINDLQP